jgi:hypothetical protein
MRSLLAAAVTLSVLSAGTLGAAQRDATGSQLAAIEAYVDREVARTHGGAPLEAAQATLLRARAELAAALAARSIVDLVRVRADVAAQRAAIEARLAEVGRTCGPIPDTAPARARRDALIEVEANLARGVFVPPS